MGSAQGSDESALSFGGKLVDWVSMAGLKTAGGKGSQRPVALMSISQIIAEGWHSLTVLRIIADDHPPPSFVEQIEDYYRTSNTTSTKTPQHMTVNKLYAQLQRRALQIAMRLSTSRGGASTATTSTTGSVVDDAAIAAREALRLHAEKSMRQFSAFAGFL